jgi:hypothetical protein
VKLATKEKKEEKGEEEEVCRERNVPISNQW